MSWLKPRSIRGQLITGLILLEGLLVVVFATLLVREQASEIHERARLRLESEVNLLALQSEDSLAQGQGGYIMPILRAMTNSPSIRAAMVTDPNGKVIAASSGIKSPDPLTRLEKKHLADAPGAVIFRAPGGAREAVVAIHVAGQLRGFAWVYEDATAAWQQIYSLIRITIMFAGLGALGTAIIAGTLAGSITRPLRALLTATRKLIRDPETKEGFPLEVTSANEAADLTRAFNLMVTSMEEQRAGLSDTLSLLDSMLENAPIGFAFFDRKFRYVRVNQFMAEMTQTPIGRQLGRTIEETLPGPAAEMLQGCIQSVFETGEPVVQFELNTPLAGDETSVRSWLINVYPVKTTSEAVRWVGAIALEATERKRAEDALRKTEKLAAAGRLAASIAHEINNPLEAVTNLLYLLRHQPSLDEEAIAYADMAQQEISRVAEMTQQTLRFYRQTTLPAVANVADLLDSALTALYGAAAGAADRGLTQERARCRSLLFFRRVAPALRQPDRQCHRRHGSRRASVAVCPPIPFLGGRNTGGSIVCGGQRLRHDAGNAAADFRAVFYHQGNNRHGPWHVGERRNSRQASCHGASRQPRGRRGKRKALRNCVHALFP